MNARWISKIQLVAVLGVATSAALALSTAGPANAAIGAGRVQLCAQGNYAASLKYTAFGGGTTQTPPVSEGQCQTFDVAHANNQPTSITIVGIFNVSRQQFDVPGGPFKSFADTGAKLAATGSTAKDAPQPPKAVQYPNQ
jgi:hypothetical protein